MSGFYPASVYPTDSKKTRVGCGNSSINMSTEGGVVQMARQRKDIGVSEHISSNSGFVHGTSDIDGPWGVEWVRIRTDQMVW